MKYVLTGPVHSGKTTLLEKLVGELEKSGVRSDGFLSLSVRKNREIIGYDLFSVKTKTSTPFLRKKGQQDWMKTGPFFFLPGGLIEANRIILSPEPNEILIVDEIGPLELEGRGLWPAFERVAHDAAIPILCVVRRTILENFLKSTPEALWHVFDIEDKNVLIRLLDSLGVHTKV